MDAHATFSLPDSLPARALAPLPSSTVDHHRFVIGSCCLNSGNNMVRSRINKQKIAGVDFLETEGRIDVVSKVPLGNAEVISLDSVGSFVVAVLNGSALI